MSNRESTPLFTEVPRETVWKMLSTSQPPYHEMGHRHIDERFSGGAQPLVVLAHPTVLVQPREGALHNPAPRQYHEASRRHQLLPIDLLSLLGPLLRPGASYLFRDGLGRAAHDLAPQTEDLLRPPLAPALVTCVQPEVLQPRHRC